MGGQYVEEQLWLMVLPCYQVRYLSLNIHKRNLFPGPLRKYQEDQSLAESLNSAGSFASQQWSVLSQVPVGTGAPQELGVKRVQDACLSFPGASHGFLEMGWDGSKGFTL